MRRLVLSAFLLLLAAFVRVDSSSPSPYPLQTPAPRLLPFEDYWSVNIVDTNTSCIMMRAKLSVKVIYDFNETSITAILPVSGIATVNFNGKDDHLNSTCDHGSSGHTHNSQLVLKMVYGQLPPCFLTFGFQEDTEKGHQLWKLDRMNLTFSSSVLSHYNDTADDIFAWSNDDVFENELERSYRCDAAQRYELGTIQPTKVISKYNITHVYVDLEDWRVQAFSFRKDHENEYGNSRRCQTDLNKKDTTVVPIAVGALLGVLVIVVIIAYLIGRFRSRRSSASYEPLS